MEWRFLDTGRAPGALNMAIDEAIATLHARGCAPPTIRVYGWEPACLSIGYFQSVGREIDVESCRKAGIDLIRRPTGGRAVLHDDELTYSLIATENDPLISGGVVESYRKISAGLLAGLEGLGIDAEIAPSRNGHREQYRSAACFDTASSYELTVGGKKLVGSAQVRRNGVVLQHGSLLLSFDGGKLLSLLRFGSAGRSTLDCELAERVTSLAAIDRQEIGFADAAAALRRGFEKVLNICLIKSDLTKEEKALADQLLLEKYSTAAWNFRK